MTATQWKCYFDNFKPTKIANRDGHRYTTSRQDFIGSNTAGGWTRGLYVVYSYGLHWPMFAYNPKNNTWYINQDKYSPTTSKQTGQLRPYPFMEQGLVHLSVEAMRELVERGDL